MIGLNIFFMLGGKGNSLELIHHPRQRVIKKIDILIEFLMSFCHCLKTGGGNRRVTMRRKNDSRLMKVQENIDDEY